MRTSTDLDILVEPGEVTPRRGVTHGDIPIVVLRRGRPGNDATCEDPAISKDELEPWARHALAANGFGDVGTTDAASSERPMSYELYQAARAHRSFSLGEIIVAAIQAAGAIARRVYLRHRQRREARATYDALHQLDDRTLHDLGFDRSEILSLAAEVTGEAEYTHIRALQTVAPVSERPASTTSLEIANATIALREQNERKTMHRYETSTPRIAFGIAAVAMTVFTISVFVVAPAMLNASAHEPGQLAASTVTTPATIGVVPGARIEVAAVHAPGLTQLQAHRPNRIGSQKVE